MIIDVHTHLGDDRLFDSHRNEEELIRVSQENEIDKIIVQPAQTQEGIDTIKKMHDRIVRFSKDYPNRVYGMAAINPHFDWNIYMTEATRCIKDLGFLGLKVTPLTHGWNPYVEDGAVPFEAAKSLNVPLMAHVGIGLPFALPSNLMFRARQFPDVILVIAHSGVTGLEHECLLLAKECDNVFLETSVRTTNLENIYNFVKSLGPERVMFASDSPDEMAHAIWMCRNCGLNDNELEWVLGKTAQNVFGITD